MLSNIYFLAVLEPGTHFSGEKHLEMMCDAYFLAVLKALNLINSVNTVAGATYSGGGFYLKIAPCVIVFFFGSSKRGNSIKSNWSHVFFGGNLLGNSL